MRPKSRFTRFAHATARVSGHVGTFITAAAVILIWAITGPLFHFSDTWQLVINTGTTIVTFLMVFLIQNTQNRDNAALQAKLDELIRVGKAKNSFIGIEHLSDTELETILTEAERVRPQVARRAEQNVRRRKAQDAAARRNRPAPRKRKSA